MLAILTYHSIDDSGSVVSIAPHVFAEQMKALAAAGFQGISLHEALAFRQANRHWPERCVVLTFDDGFANFYETAMPELAKHDFTATVFVISGHVGGNNDWDSPPAGLGSQRMLSWPQVKELAKQGIEIGAHTRTHPDLRRLSEPDIEEEIAGCCAEISDHIGQPVENFAYPYGYRNHQAEAVVRRTMASACTTELRRTNEDPLHLLPRVDMYYLQSTPQLTSLVEGKLDGYLTIRRWGRTVRQVLGAH
ncbi:MAG: polysaccharide deacetylase family protein [Acidobacteria bacterium]|nr:polysaccharide deacetylase family protein [Acidobacteriota bacterium]